MPGVLNLDGAAFYYFLATGVTPAMEKKLVGRGSQYAWTARDADGNPLDGGKNYKHLPPNIPVKDFWSVILYSNQTRSMTQTDQRFPSVSSQTKGLLINPEGSVDVYFGPTAPAGKEKNWVQTIPGKGWNTILRLYGPLEPWFNQTWPAGGDRTSALTCQMNLDQTESPFGTAWALIAKNQRRYPPMTRLPLSRLLGLGW
jgi:hypothetical protein